MPAPPPRPNAARPAAGVSASASAGSSSKADAQKTVGTFFLGRYRVVEEIGIGGMASVHLARLDGAGGFQKWVAIKRIHPNLVEDDQFVDMFLDEARIAASINHANVAQVFELGKDDNTYWIAMEYLHGEPLREIMRRCEDRNELILPDLAARICSDAAEGLHSAHELRGKNGQLLGLVHRDVTPHNLFITYEGYTKVVDFGIAKVADRLSETRAGTLKGKLAYMSPEQVRGQDDVDRTTDVFALGVVLWELTTGQRLFRMDTDLDTLEKVQACVVPPPSSVIPGYPVELEAVVMKALAKRKPDRYQTARELSRALQTYLLRRGVFVGPEEVATFVRELFRDRIKSREEHLAWAADVTSTINIDQLKSAKLGSIRDEVSMSSLSVNTSSEVDGAPTGQKDVPPPGTGPMAARRNKIPNAQKSSNTNASISMQSSLSRQVAASSLLEDDEDVPTTVASHNHVRELAAEAVKAKADAVAAIAASDAASAAQKGPSFAGGASLGGGGGGPVFGGGAGPSFGGAASSGPNSPPRPAQPSGPQNFSGLPDPPPLNGGMNGSGNQQKLLDPNRNHLHGGTLAMPAGQNPFTAPNNNGGGASGYQQGADPKPNYPSGSFSSSPSSGFQGSGLPSFGPPPSPQTNPNQPGSNQQTGAGSPGFGSPASANTPYPPMNGAMSPGFGAVPAQSSNFPSFGQQGGPGQQGMQPGQNGAGAYAPRQFAQGGGSPLATVMSQPRPDVAAILAAQQRGGGAKKNTTMLIAVALLTAICVAAIAGFIYLKYKAGTDPKPDASSSAAGASAAPAPSSAVSATSQQVVVNSAGASSAKVKDDQGYLTVICKPFCDSVKRGDVVLGGSPIVKSPAPPGDYKLTLSRKGSPDQAVNVTIVAGETNVLHVNMK